MRIGVFAAVLTALPVIAVAQQTCVPYQEEINSVSEKLQAQFDEYKKEAEDLKRTVSSSPRKLIFTNISVDVATVTLKYYKFGFNSVEIITKSRTVPIDTTTVRMVAKKTGQYPEFTCDHGLIPRCSTRWVDITSNVPETVAEHRDLEVLVPAIKVAETDIALSTPDFVIRHQEFPVDLPELNPQDRGATPDEVKSKGQKIRSMIALMQSTQVRDSVLAVNKLYSCLRGNLAMQRERAATNFENTLSKISASTRELAAKGVDETKIKDDIGKTPANYQKDLLKIRDKTLADFDFAIDQLNASEKETVIKLTSEPY
jgi:hypothetical protein